MVHTGLELTLFGKVYFKKEGKSLLAWDWGRNAWKGSNGWEGILGPLFHWLGLVDLAFHTFREREEGKGPLKIPNFGGTLPVEEFLRKGRMGS